MARTLQTLQTMVRRRMGFPSSDTFVTDAELREMLRESQHELHDFLIATFGAEYRIVTSTVGLASGIYAAGLTGMSRIHRVAIRFNSVSKPFRHMTLQNGVVDMTPIAWDLGTDLQFRVMKLVDDTYILSVFPVPNAAQVLYVVNTLEPSTFSLSTALNSIGYDEYLVLDVMIKLKEMEESDVSVVLAQKERLIQRIQENAEPIDMGQAATIGDVRSADTFRNSRWY